MDGRRFDDVVRALFASGRGSRRRLLTGWLAAAATIVGVVGSRGGRIGAQSCPGEGEACGLLLACCPGFVCLTLPMNPNSGVCAAQLGASQSDGSGSGDGGGGEATATPTPRATATATSTPTATPSPTPTPTPTSTPTPNPREGRLEVEVDCIGPVETTVIRNVGRVLVTIERVRSLAAAAPDEPREISVDRLLAPGATLRLTSGSGAKRGRDRLAAYPLYRDGAAGRVVAIETSAGTVRASCRRGPSGTGGTDTVPPPTGEQLAVTLQCDAVPPAGIVGIKVENVGALQITIVRVDLFRGTTVTGSFPIPGGDPKNSVVLESRPTTNGSGEQVTFTSQAAIDANVVFGALYPLSPTILPGDRARVVIKGGAIFSATCPGAPPVPAPAPPRRRRGGRPGRGRGSGRSSRGRGQ